MILGDSLSYMDTFGKLDSSKTSRVTQAISSCDSFFLLFSLSPMKARVNAIYINFAHDRKFMLD